jgi:hypothetical protein
LSFLSFGLRFTTPDDQLAHVLLRTAFNRMETAACSPDDQPDVEDVASSAALVMLAVFCADPVHAK